VPSGASTGSAEALELRDGGIDWSGKAVYQAVRNVNEVIAPALVGHDASDQAALDQIMLDLDGTDNKSKLGANAILSVSLAAAKAAASAKNQPLWRYVAEMTDSTPVLPLPMMNVLNGGAHAAFATDIQEFMIICKGAQTFADTLKMGTEIFHALAKVLKNYDYPTTVGDEGGYAPRVRNGNREALALLSEAIQNAGYELGRDVVFAMDAASSEFYQDGRYELKCEGKSLSSSEMVDWLEALTNEFPIVSIEDGLAENDWDGWKLLRERLGDRIQLVGDDLLVTNTSLIERAITEQTANALLVKPNQIGSLTETIQAVKMAQNAGLICISLAKILERSRQYSLMERLFSWRSGVSCKPYRTASALPTEKLLKISPRNAVSPKCQHEPSAEQSGAIQFQFSYHAIGLSAVTIN
jgi:enolase